MQIREEMTVNTLFDHNRHMDIIIWNTQLAFIVAPYMQVIHTLHAQLTVNAFVV